MKNIEIDEALYQHIASNTQYIGESASSILRRLLSFDETSQATNPADELSTVSAPTPSIATQPTTENVTSDEIPTEVVAQTTIQDKSSVFDYINKEELAMQRGAVGRFLLILAALYRVHQQLFANVCDIRGRDRLYFANNEEALAESGSSTKPRQIPESPYWVITNSNTTRKKMMLTEVAISLGYSAEEAENIRDLL
ncbi:replication initiation negative regulator SeqA [Thalassotalea agariperforans]